MTAKSRPAEERFFESIAKTSDGCWEWQRAVDADGYGLFRVGSQVDGTRRSARAHRWAYEHFVGEIPSGLTIDHLCRNRRCANPDHLEAVTAAVNTKRGERANATHCKQGHALSGDNLYIGPSDGKRGCRACRNKRTADHNRATGWEAQRSYAKRTNYAATRAYRQRLKSASATNCS